MYLGSEKIKNLRFIKFYLQMYDCCFSDTGIVDCKSSWKKWGSCTKSCGTGEQVFMQDIEVYPENGGKPCDTETRKTVRCNTHSCPIKVDCEWSDWSKSGHCSKIGEQLYMRTRVIQAENGGRPCLGLAQMVEPC